MLRLILCLLAVVLIGCGEVTVLERSTSGNYASGGEGLIRSIPANGDIDFDGDGLAYANSNEMLFEATAIDQLLAPDSANTRPVAAETPPATAGRKIIYNADVRMVVSELDEFLEKVRQLIASQGGFIGSSTETGMDGSNPSATITVRVPSAGYQPLLIELDNLGTVEQRSETSRDVTAEFVDVEARIRNKEREEARLLELLAEAEGKLKEILEVERELSRVRGEIERAQGQMNVLRDQIDLATITIHATERRVYTPPTQASFGDRVSTAWGNSLTNLREFGSRAAIEITAFAPWLVIWVPLLAIAWFVGRKLWRALKRNLVSAVHTLRNGRSSPETAAS